MPTAIVWRISVKSVTVFVCVCVRSTFARTDTDICVYADQKAYIWVGIRIHAHVDRYIYLYINKQIYMYVY